MWGLGPRWEIELLSIHREFLRQAGASDVLLTLFDADWIEEEDRRNLVRQEVRRAIFYGDLEGYPSDFTHEGGACFSALWDGNLYEAFRYHADLTQCSQLESVFGEDRINADRPDQDAPEVSELDPLRHFICHLPPPPDLDEK